MESRLPEWVRNGRRAAAIAIALVLAVAAANAAMLCFAGSRSRTTSYQLGVVAGLLNQHTDVNSVVGTYDAGVLGYYAEATVVNLDGLANSFDYFENYAQPGKFAEYFQATGMTHFLVRDSLLENADEVERGQYETARLRLDPRIVLRRDRERFRYRLPGGFAVYGFELEQPK